MRSRNYWLTYFQNNKQSVDFPTTSLPVGTLKCLQFSTEATFLTINVLF